MPRLVFKGIELEELQKISARLLDDIAIAIDRDKSNFMLEYPNTTFVADGKEVRNFPLVAVHWFPRNQEMCGRVAKIIQDAIKALGYQTVEVYFVDLDKDRYYS